MRKMKTLIAAALCLCAVCAVCAARYSVFSIALDGSDAGVRLEQYMAAEYGGKDGWQIERCYMMSDEVERAKALTRAEKEYER